MAGNVMEFTDANWSSEVLGSDVPVLVDFWAPWCGPCRMLAPTIEKLAGELTGKVKIGKMNTDENQDTPGGLRISAIPTVLVFPRRERSGSPGWRQHRGQVQDRPVQAGRGLRPVRVKVCGLTSPASALACARAGVDWVGLNFYPGSPRFVSTARASEIRSALPETTEAVGVFVNRPQSEVFETARKVGLDLIQLHGGESAEYVADLRATFGVAPLRVIVAFRLANRSSIDRMVDHLVPVWMNLAVPLTPSWLTLM